MISPNSLGFYRVPGVVAMLVMVDDGGELLDSVGTYRRIGVRTVRLLYWLYVYSYSVVYCTWSHYIPGPISATASVQITSTEHKMF